MPIPQHIPAGARIVVRVYDGVDGQDGRMKFRDYIGHVRSWDGQCLELTRDAAANGSRPEQKVSLEAGTIATVKPIPERREQHGSRAVKP
ncbi:DUF6725 family protein [Bifidobacterium subtile]|jgi:hypothetical protein|uniref:DUF6725 family protein n=1 Tax=Bifidobacterium subtile TaxID=77635 RepID=UPI002F3555EF